MDIYTTIYGIRVCEQYTGTSANNKEVDLLLIILGKSFIYNRNAVVPRWNLVARHVEVQTI